MAVKCKNGHWYDPNMYSNCPHCKRAGEQLRLILDEDVEEDDRTVSIAEVDVSLGEQLERLGALGGLEAAGERAAGVPGKAGISDSGTVPGLAGGSREEEDDRTVSFGFFGMGAEKPVTGWLVCTFGEMRGQDFRLHAGKNFVGRSPSMDVVLAEDKAVSRNRHCAVTYDPVGNGFYVMPSGGNSVYYNGEMIEDVKRLRLGDQIQIGDTILVFVPFCQEGITWEEE